MNLVALGVERIRRGVQDAEKVHDVQARRHVAVLVVGLTLPGTVLIAWLAGQLRPPAGAVVLVLGGAWLASQLRGPARLRDAWRAITKEAFAAVDALRKEEHESVA